MNSVGASPALVVVGVAATAAAGGTLSWAVGAGRGAAIVGSAAAVVVASGAALLLRSVRRERARAARMQKLLEDVFRRAPVGLALVDRYGTIRHTNRAFAALLGKENDVLDGARLSAASRTLAQTVVPELRVVTRSPEPAVDATERRESIELDVDGDTRFVDASVFPVALDEEERGASAAGLLLMDMTRQREWELELQAERDRAETANRAKSAFIANMSHELRTPITAVLGYCELLEDEARDAGAAALLEDLGKIAVNARHLLGLINDILDFSRIEAQRLEIHPLDIRLDAFLDETVAAVESLMLKNRNRFRAVNAAQGATLFTDDLRLRQILLNLVGNAAKFTQDGDIELRAESFERDDVAWMRFVVTDDGVGMTADQVAGLFRRFAQGDETTTRKYGGAGLGLALSKAIAEMLGGTIAARSAPQQGSTFTVEIPCRYAATASGAVATEPSREEPAAAASSAVLVIDDDPYAREFLSRVLTREGFSVATESDGPRGLSAARRIQPIAILLDVMLPGLDGWRVLRELRADPRTKNIPVIVQTVLDDRNFAYALGASAYLRKPIGREDLAATVAEFVPAPVGAPALVVDDDPETILRLSEMLARDGWSVQSAPDGAAALERMKDRKPALALVDLLMPGMDGYGFIRRVRENPAWDDVRIVVLTADDVSRRRLTELRQATSGVVQKGAMPLADLVRDLRRFAGGRGIPQRVANGA
jgi:PAS domain S-box-containing protein